MGWMWYFNDSIPLYRDWTKDENIIAKSMQTLNMYKDPFLLLFFPEGTRLTKGKYDASCKIAQEKGLPHLKHHLLPRVRGFRKIIQSLNATKIR